jgi:phospholipase C
LKKFNPNINGLTGKETNPIDPSNPSAGSQRVSFDAADLMMMNPGHGVPSTFLEMFGEQNGAVVDPAPMDGFIAELVGEGYALSEAVHVMRCFNETSLPSLSWLARNYAVFDSWFSSVPGPTFVNRAFAWAGTSAGWAVNSIPELFEGFPEASIFAQFANAANVSYRIYFGDVPTPIVLDDVRFDPLYMRPMDEFASDAAAGALPAFTWLDPRYFTIGAWSEQDQHPGAYGVAAGTSSG